MRKDARFAMTAAITTFMGVASLAGCSSEGGNHATDPVSSAPPTLTSAVPLDYSQGRAMNTRLGKGINLGNAWDGESYWSCGKLGEGDNFTYTNLNGETKSIVLSKSDEAYFNNLPTEPYNFGCEDHLDAGWKNPIEDSYFPLLKAAGFNSIRLPVRWQHNSDPIAHTVNPERLAGVIDDIQKAINAGLAVVVSFHRYYEINFAANKATQYPDLYEAEKAHFASIWNQVATALNAFPDDMIVFDILNEPTITSTEKLNEVMTLGYQTIRAAATNKTIMFESNSAAKFDQLENLKLPADGNIIYSGHYYEPYDFSHQGHSYACKGDAAYANTAANDLKSYAQLATLYYPDINGGSVPLNMGEFGISGGEYATTNTCDDGGDPPSAAAKARWAEATIKAANANGMSWHYWGFVQMEGFEAYDYYSDDWNQGFPAAFGL